MTPEQAQRVALAILTGEGDTASGGIRTDGAEVAALALLLRTGVVVTVADGEEWTPPAWTLYPGWANFDLAARALEHGRARLTGQDVGEIAAAAVHDPAARRACERVAAILTAQGDPVPSALAAAIAQDAPRARRHGPHPAKRRPRDWLIARAVHELSRDGLSVYRNDSAAPDSACDAVAAALVRMGSPASYAAVARVWRRHTGKPPK